MRALGTISTKKIVVVEEHSIVGIEMPNSQSDVEYKKGCFPLILMKKHIY